MKAQNWYLTAGRPCAEAFMRHDGLRPRHAGGTAHYLDHRRQFHDMRGTQNIIHIIDGWWMGRPAGWAQDFIEEILWMARTYPGFKIIERDERELFGPEFYRELYPWASTNPWRLDREHIKKRYPNARVKRDPFGQPENIITVLTPEEHNRRMEIATMRYLQETGRLPGGKN